MEELGCPVPTIAAELRSRWGMRAREAFRHAAGLTHEQLADRLTEAAGGEASCDATTVRKAEKWPLAAGDAARRPSVRHLAALAAFYGCAPQDLLDLEDRRALPADDLALLTARAPLPAAPAPLARTTARPVRERADIGALTRQAADESAAWVGRREESRIGPLTAEQIEADLTGLAAAYLHEGPHEVFAELVALRDRLWSLMERPRPPLTSLDLHRALGYTLTLLAWISSDLRDVRGAETQARAARLVADEAGDPALFSWLASAHSKIAVWRGRLQEAAAHAEAGLARPAPGTVGVLLACQVADAASFLGDHAATRTALERAARARDTEQGRDHVGGLLSCPPYRSANYEAAALLRLGETTQALAATELALATLPEHSYGTAAQLHISHAGALLPTREYAEVRAALAPVLILAPAQRLGPVVQRVRDLQARIARDGGDDALTLSRDLDTWASQAQTAAA
ncbi:hypothetical protein CAC01_30815 (plasmid) [Streptomyces sp. CLI2509]|nr:hypothetical protein CAC01_30815 [Streptomyces sp. CLI2509]